jgi:hypothetical protein
MSNTGPIQWYHFQADLILTDGTFNYFFLSATWYFSNFCLLDLSTLEIRKQGSYVSVYTNNTV